MTAMRYLSALLNYMIYRFIWAIITKTIKWVFAGVHSAVARLCVFFYVLFAFFILLAC